MEPRDLPIPPFPPGFSESSDALYPPCKDRLLTYEHVEIHEALFMLTKWPKKLVATTVPYPIGNEIGRLFLYVASPGTFDPRRPGSLFNVVLKALKKSIKHGELAARSAYVFSSSEWYGSNTSYLIKPINLIWWAVLNASLCSEGFIKPLNINFLKGLKLKKNPHERVKNQIVGQYLLAIDPTLSVADLCRHTWMADFGTANESKDSEKRAIRRALDDLFKVPRICDWSVDSKRGKDRSFTLKPIVEVMQKDQSGVPFYNFPLLKTAIQTLAQLRMNLIEKDELADMTSNAFSFKMFNDKVMKLYLDGAPPIVLDLARRLCHEALIGLL